MGTWYKNNCIVRIVNPTTGSPYAGTITVQFQPIDSAFSTSAVLGTQLASVTDLFKPVSDLNTLKLYDVHVSHAAIAIGRIFGPDTVTIPEA